MRSYTTVVSTELPCIWSSGKGWFHDLDELFDELNEEYFGGRICAWVHWDNVEPKGRAYYELRLGAYCYDDRIITIHPCLDRRFVPQYFVAHVLHHEMCHQVCEPVRDARGRYRFHTPEFRAAERQYRYYERALKWDRANIDRLLRY
jgi:hypothetical protein